MIHIEPYVLSEEIHRAGAVVVYRGHRQSDGAPVLAKILADDYPTARDVAKLRHEYSILRDIDAPGVVKVLHLKRYRSGAALIMVDPGGESLHGVMYARRLDLTAILKIAASAADAIGAVHHAGVIHKHITPQNILVCGDDLHAVLFDFDAATRLSQEAQTAMGPQAIEGTLTYMSPEQTGRMNRVVDHRTDFYSFGATLYELLVGAAPFTTTNPTALVHSHIAKMPVPPHERSADIPDPVSQIVMKLLSKAAEDRYQHARGLKADILRCLSEWEEHGRITPFPLGEHDLSDRIRVPQKLYGREKQISTLLDAFGRMSKGVVELLLVTGSAGIGKSTLVREIHKAIARRGGYFIAGKFDTQRSRNAPYAGIVHAFQDLVRQIVLERADVVEQFRQDIQRAVEPNGQVILEIIPELEQLIGPQPAVSQLDPTAVKNRLVLAFQSFVRVLATVDHPLVLFLDDVQWVDPASLKLLQGLLTDAGCDYLLVIVAFRDDEVGTTHPLALMLAELLSMGTAVGEIKLGALAVESVAELLRDTLRCHDTQAESLAAVLFETTQGNPFFLRQLLLTLQDEGFIVFDPQVVAFSWDLKRVRERLSAADVVSLMAAKIRRLPAETQELLTLAACIGHKVDLQSLATIHEKAPPRTAAALWPALREELLMPLDSDYRLLDTPVQDTLSESLPAVSKHVSYRFVHDRVQQAAYSLVDDARRRALHLRIGRLLKAQGEPRGDDLFELVRHWNIGAALVTDPDERIDLARWNLAAGGRARASAANAAAAGYFETGMSMLPAASFQTHHDLSFALHLGLAECEYLNSRLERADCIFDDVLGHATTLSERANVHVRRASVYLTMSKLAEALQVGLAGLALFDIAVPDTDEGWQAAFSAELAQIEVNQAGRSTEDLIHSPVLEDRDLRALMRLLMSIFPPAYNVNPTIAAVITAKMTNLSLKHGHSPVSAFAYMTHGFTLTAAFGRYREGYAFCKLALDLNDKFANADLVCKLNVMFGVTLPFSRPLPAAVDCLVRAYHAGLSSGDFPYLSFACEQILRLRFSIGHDLAALLEDADRFFALMQRTQEALALESVTLVRQAVRNAMGRTSNRFSLSDDDHDEDELLQRIEARRFTQIVFWYYLVKAQVFFLNGNPQRALIAALEAEKRVASAAGQVYMAELSFYLCLILAALYPDAPSADKEHYALTIETHQAKLALWAEGCRENFHHKHVLVSAELARIHGRDLKAMDLYDEAITAAGAGGIFRDEILAHELAARYFVGRRRDRIARGYMTDAYYGYLQWGATVKADEIASTYAHLLPDGPRSREARKSAAPPLHAAGSSAVASPAFSPDVLDLTAVMNAAHAIVSEIMLDKVLDQMMRIVVESSGAQRAVLLLDRSGEYVAEACMDIVSDKVLVGPTARSSSETAVPLSIVGEVATTGQPVVIDDASYTERPVRDPYFAAAPTKSVLCLALTYRNRRTGVLYLENHTVASVFTRARVEVCSLLASQAAIALENAILYQDVKDATEKLQHANEALETTVALRTEELREANARLTVELTEREKTEQARALLQEQVILGQQERLVELSTPMIPITDRIVVMPLIGTVDALRAQKVHEAALDGAARTQAEVVILDITGVKTIDAGVAATLVSTARALGLLGVHAVITGIRPDVAQALVQIDVDLGALVTHGTLQSGIAYALRRSSAPAFRGGGAARQRLR